jgi:hypothetical protein
MRIWGGTRCSWIHERGTPQIEAFSQAQSRIRRTQNRIGFKSAFSIQNIRYQTLHLG